MTVAAILRCTALGVVMLMSSPATAAQDLSPLDAATVQGVHLGVLVTELPSGRVRFAYHADDAFTPASTLKLVTGVAALRTLGTTATFATDLILRGSKHGARFDGDVELRMGGDPLFRRADLDDALHALAARGIHEVRGELLIRSRLNAPPYPDGWLIDDEPAAYAAPVTGIVLDENTLQAVVTPGRPGARAEVAVDAADARSLALLGLTLGRDATTGPPGADDTLAPEETPSLVGVTGIIPASAPAEQIAIAVPDPAAFVRARMQAGLERIGIRFTFKPSASRRAHGEVVVRHHVSPPLAAIVRTMWLRSDNVIAETLLEQIGATVRPDGDLRAAGLARERELLLAMGVSPAAFELADGSGLSRYSLVTPRLFARLLTQLWTSDLRNFALASLPLAGERGTLQDRFLRPPLAGAFYAKTGGMRHVGNLAGYLHTRSGRWLSVTILADDALLSDERLNALQTAILNALASSPH